MEVFIYIIGYSWIKYCLFDLGEVIVCIYICFMIVVVIVFFLFVVFWLIGFVFFKCYCDVYCFIVVNGWVVYVFLLL